MPEVSGELVVIDTYNCYMKQGEYWYPYRFHFEAEARAHSFISKGGFTPDLEHPVRWNTPIRFLKTFYGHRRKFFLYHAFAPLEILHLPQVAVHGVQIHPLQRTGEPSREPPGSVPGERRADPPAGSQLPVDPVSQSPVFCHGGYANGRGS